MIVKIADGQPVPGPGQYDMSMDHYHSQACCPGPSVSSTGLRKIFLESPADFWATSELNDKRFEPEPTDAFTFGRAAHALLLGDECFEEKFCVVPMNAPPEPLPSQWKMLEEGRDLTKSATERLDFWAPFYQKHRGKAFLKEADLEAIFHIRDALLAHEIVPVLLEGQAEQSLIWQDEETGIWLKSRLDILSSTGDFADLKSTSDKDPRRLMAGITRYGYDMQLGLNTMAVEQVLGIPFDEETYAARSAILLFVYKKPPFHIMPVEVPFGDLFRARQKCRLALNTMARCIKEDRWPGPVEGILTYHAPDWEIEKMAELASFGDLVDASY